MEKTGMQTVRFDNQGRAIIPAKLRRAFGAQKGDEVIAWVEDGRMVMESREALVKRIRARYADIDVSLADELIQERHETVRYN